MPRLRNPLVLLFAALLVMGGLIMTAAPSAAYNPARSAQDQALKPMATPSLIFVNPILINPGIINPGVVTIKTPFIVGPIIKTTLLVPKITLGPVFNTTFVIINPGLTLMPPLSTIPPLITLPPPPPPIVTNTPPDVPVVIDPGATATATVTLPALPTLPPPPPPLPTIKPPVINGAPTVPPGQPIPVAPTAAPLPNLPTPVVSVSQPPTTYQSPLIAFVDSTGDVNVTSMGVNPGAYRLTVNGGGTGVSPYTPGARDYNFLRWSPDGTALLFMSSEFANGTTVTALYVAESGQRPRLVTSAAATDFGGVWSPDGKEIGFAVQAGAPGADMMQLYQLQAVPRAGGSPRAVGTFKMMFFGEGSPQTDPADYLVAAERYRINNSAMAWLQNGILHPVNGLYNTGVQLTAFDGTLIWDQAGVGIPVLSPDKTKLVAISTPRDGGDGSSIFVIDAKTGQSGDILYNVPGVSNISAVGWGADSDTVYFALANPAGTLAAQNNPLAQQIGNGMSIESTTYDTALWRVSSSAGSGSAAQLFAVKGRIMLDLTPVNQNMLVFTYIESSERQVNAINNNDSAAPLLGPRALVGSFVEGGQVAFFDKDSRRPAASLANAPFTAVGP